MISKLPRWVLIGGGALAFIAGIINAVGFLSVYRQGITHLTGTTTLLGISVAEGNLAVSLHLLAFIGSFLAGAIASGFIIQDSTLSLGRRYGVALMLESLLLFLAVPFLHRGYFAGDCLASCACGLQNAMVSTYSGAVLRTTHVSGVFTDIGIFIGHWLRRLPVDFRRLRLWLVLIFSFGAGGTVGAASFARLAYGTLYLPAALTGLTGLAYGIYRHKLRAKNQPAISLE
ncbi:MAG TPA: YoaK family protein [Opitutaceae bacterium]|nr:YoaK family protein [Opitutaceae bacterium]